MANRKPKNLRRETAALEALRQGMALIKRGSQVYGLHEDGSKELLVKSKDRKKVWGDVVDVLRAKGSKGAVSEDNDVNNTSKIRIYSDGGSRGNPGPSATGYVILSGDESYILEQGGAYLGITTNNQAEYQAVKQALESARKFEPKEVEVLVDSLLVANQLNGIFKVKNKELWPVHDAIKKIAQEFESISFRHVYREDNKLADEQVNIILDEEAKLQKGN